MTTQKQIRASFWQTFPQLAMQCRAAGLISKRQNHHCATVRCSFGSYLDSLVKDERITAALARRTTL